MSEIYLIKPDQPANSTPHPTSNEACPECLFDVRIHIDPVGIVIMTCDLRHRAAGEVILPNRTPQVVEIGFVRGGWISLHRMANTDWVGAFKDLSQWINFMSEDLCFAAFGSATCGVDLIDFPVPVVTALLEVLDYGPHDSDAAEALALMREADACGRTQPIELVLV